MSKSSNRTEDLVKIRIEKGLDQTHDQKKMERHVATRGAKDLLDVRPLHHSDDIAVQLRPDKTEPSLSQKEALQNTDVSVDSQFMSIRSIPSK